MKFDRNYKPELCACTDFTRPHLNHVELDVERKRLLATDGHRLVSVPCEIEAGDTSGPLPDKALDDARKSAKKAKISEAQIACDTHAKVPASGTQYDRPPARTFPPIDQIIPTDRKATISFSAKYLKEIADAIGSPDGVVTLGLGEANDDPIMVWAGHTAGRDGDAFAVLMPCRIK